MLVCESEGWDAPSMVTTMEYGACHFPLYWAKNPLAINGFDFEFLTTTEREVVNILDEFNIMNSREIIELDRGEDYKIDEYLCRFNFHVFSQLEFLIV